jgi:hypothetical protein
MFKPSIRLEEDTPACSPEGSLDEGSSTPVPRTLPGESGLAPIPEAILEASNGPVAPNPGPAGEVVAVVKLPSPEADWQKPSVEYHQLGMIPNDKTKTRQHTHRTKGCLIHDNEVYQRSTSGILQRCIPRKGGKALHLNIHEGICGHLLAGP